MLGAQEANEKRKPAQTRAIAGSVQVERESPSTFTYLTDIPPPLTTGTVLSQQNNNSKRNGVNQLPVLKPQVGYKSDMRSPSCHPPPKPEALLEEERALLWF